MLVINPDECIDCGVCEPECPAEAIVPDTEPEGEKFAGLNAELSKEWPVITEQKGPLPNADKYKDIKGKFKDLIR
jgi:ferredoxin